MSENETTYHIENAPSGRAKCKKCKEGIAKGELRICTNAFKEGQDFKFTSYQHPKCFIVPPRALKGVSPEEFVEDILEDQTDENILDDPDKKAEIVAAVAYKPSKKKASLGGGGDGEGNAVSKRLAAIKKVMETLPDDDDDESEEEVKRPSKKAKKSKGENLETYAKAMKKYQKLKADDLKSILRWNLGYGTSGNKDILLLRCIDGHVNGRLARCPTCFKGKLNLNDSDAGATIICKGYFNEEIQNRIPCQYSCPVADTPRLQPWYSSEPTEEETEAMKAITEKHEALADGGGGESSDDIPPVLAKEAAKLESSWDTSDRKNAAQTIVDLCTTHEVTVDLPQDEKKARKAVGKILLSNMDATCAEMLALVVKEFGWASVKEDAKARQKSALAGSCTVAENGGIVQALQELGDLYFKDGNSNAGLTYKKAVASITALDYEITADNAKGLCKGKTKVAGIGKGTSDKIYEFCTTGTIQKLEEKRLVHS
mmetsp:Transcript_16797/g.35519  ORF Transcript_16797/g.35519 Transcript_16797/m.35519 type:complete len:486 (+) Transcript_16797:230-1687(+)